MRLRLLARIALVASLAPAWPAAADGNPLGFVVDDPAAQIVQVGAQRIGRTQYLYTFRVRLTNESDQNARNVTAAVTSSAPTSVVVDGTLGFGDVPAGSEVQSSDTFSIRQDRAGPFDPSALSFAFYYQVEPPEEVVVPYVTGLDESAADAAITAASLSVGAVALEFSTSVPAGHVIAQSPSAETRVDAGHGVDLTVSQGPEFTLELPKPYVDIPQGAALLVPVRVSRNPAASTSNVTVQLEGGGLAGFVTSNFRVLSAPIDELWLAVSADVAAPVGGPVDVRVEATGNYNEASLPLHVRVVPARPTSGELIASALAAGTIDYGTSLVYRARARMQDVEGVPPELRGSGFAAEDPTLDYEISQALPDLPAELAAQLTAFRKRPDEPGSAWGWPAAGSGTAGFQALGPIATAEFDPPAATLNESLQRLHDECFASAVPHQITERHPTLPFRVHALCTGQAPIDTATLISAEVALQTLDLVWAEMTALMGSPPPDGGGGGDDAYDIYLFGQTALSRALTTIGVPDPNMELGRCLRVGLPAPPGASYIAISASGTADPQRLSLTLVHEFFHALQAPYITGSADFRSVSASPPVFEEHWFTEASATWAAVHFGRTAGLSGIARRSLHARFGSFQSRKTSLVKPYVHGGAQDAYDAYVWPLFLEKETGSGQFMLDIWSGYRGLQTFQALDDQIDRVAPFGSLWKEFAFRNLNGDFQPGDPLPRDQRYVDLEPEPGVFQDNTLPATETKALGTFGRPVFIASGSVFVDVAPLGVSYVHIRSESAQEVAVDWSEIPGPGLEVQAVIRKGNGDWKYEDYSSLRRVKLCIPDIALPTKALEAWFVFSNKDRAISAPGTVRLTAAQTSPRCRCDIPALGPDPTQLTPPPGNYCFVPLTAVEGYTGDETRWARPNWIANTGLVAGTANPLGDYNQATTWQGGGRTFLGVLGAWPQPPLPPLRASEAFGGNEKGDVVGETSTAGAFGPLTAFLFRDGAMYDLGAQVEALGPFWTTSARAINTEGIIVGWAQRAVSGIQSHVPVIWGGCGIDPMSGQFGCAGTSTPVSLGYEAVDVNDSGEVLILGDQLATIRNLHTSVSRSIPLPAAQLSGVVGKIDEQGNAVLSRLRFPLDLRTSVETPTPQCGNGVLEHLPDYFPPDDERSEQCDDGNGVARDGCSSCRQDFFFESFIVHRNGSQTPLECPADSCRASGISDSGAFIVGSTNQGPLYGNVLWGADGRILARLPVVAGTQTVQGYTVPGFSLDVPSGVNDDGDIIGTARDYGFLGPVHGYVLVPLR